MDIRNPRLLYIKAALFVVAGIAASGLLLAEHPGLRTAALLAIAIWSFCRAYYFAFYVIQHYLHRRRLPLRRSPLLRPVLSRAQEKRLTLHPC